MYLVASAAEVVRSIMIRVSTHQSALLLMVVVLGFWFSSSLVLAFAPLVV